MTTSKPKPVNRRARKVESFADWMARVDAEVDEQARRMERKPPTYASLNPAQKRIVELLIERLRLLPELPAGESPFGNPAYKCISVIISELYAEKFPEWEKWVKTGRVDFSKMPTGSWDEFRWMASNCGPAVEMAAIAGNVQEEEEDD